jgi:hypothetical protein
MNYLWHYEKLIERARSRELDGYKERHHVIPRCVGGGDSKENLIELTAEEHYVAHQLLIRIYPGVRGLVFAAVMMASAAQDNPGRTKNKLYSWLKKANGTASEKWKSARHTESGLEVWASAARIYDYAKKNPSFGGHRIKRALGLKASVGGVLYAVKNGWTPAEDEEWQAFAKNIKIEHQEVDERARDDVQPFLKQGLTSAQKDIWASADVIQNFHWLYPEDGLRRVLRCLGLSEKNYTISVLKKIQQGWDPSGDAEWLHFRAEHGLPVTTPQQNWEGLRDTRTGEKSHRHGIKPWRHPLVVGEARRPWLSADTAYGLFQQGLGYVEVWKSTGIGKRSTFQGMLNKFRSGWNPSLDDDWKAWKNEVDKAEKW